ncbi:MAG: adenylate/guanylate cyclase domain-containing protein, partial [Saprospiraceae bacterium]|nr:adenylate/guanylate cyclase domain-containing protein [Saprospiraceae bacterium]
AYDIWGDTVNTASRVESNGSINTVNISESTKYLLGEKFNYTDSRSVNAKNIGQINIYNVTMI